VLPDLFSAVNRNLIIALAARYGVPAIYYKRAYAESGGLIANGDDYAEEFRQAAGYIDRILKGARPQRCLLHCISLVVALLGPREMSDLSPQIESKRTLIRCCHQSRFYEYAPPNRSGPTPTAKALSDRK
jgi:hypothetical protein